MIKLLQVDASGNVPYPEAHHPTLSKLRGLKVIGGSSLAGKFPDLSLILQDGYECPRGSVDYFRVGLLNVVSARLRDVFVSVGAETEFFPVSVYYHGRVLQNHYFAANFLIRVRAIDMSKSDVELNDELGDALSVRQLVLDESVLKGVRVAVIDEINSLAVDPTTAEAILSAGCIGCALVDPPSFKY